MSICDNCLNPLASDYWDCECDKDYIHHKGNTTYCDRCKRHEDEMPDSRLEEVLDMKEEEHRCRADENSCVDGKKCPDYVATCDCEQCHGITLKHYDIEYKVVGTFIDQVYDVEHQDEAIEKAIDNLRNDPIVIRRDDIEVLGVHEVNYESGERV